MPGPDTDNQFYTPRLVEKLTLEAKQEHQRIASIEAKALQQQQQRQIDNQRTI